MLVQIRPDEWMLGLANGMNAGKGAQKSFTPLDVPSLPWSGSRLFEDENENPSSLCFAAASEDEDDSGHHWLMCTTVAGGKPLKYVEEAWL
jgi:hypothetical protein